MNMQHEVEQMIVRMGGLATQYAEIIKRVANGTLNPELVKRQFQDIIEKRAFRSGSTVDLVELQLQRWLACGVSIDDEVRDRILQQAAEWYPITDGAEPLIIGGFEGMDVTSALHGLYGAINLVEPYRKETWIPEDAQLRRVVGLKPGTGLRLVHFAPRAHMNVAPRDAVVRERARSNRGRLAGLEVLEYLAVMPAAKLARSQIRWNLSGLRMKHQGNWSDTPYVHWHQEANFLELNTDPADSMIVGFSSPVVWEC